PHRDLMHRIPLEIVAVIACPHVGLLASKLGGKASTNLGAPHSEGIPDEKVETRLQRMRRDAEKQGLSQESLDAFDQIERGLRDLLSH
ncbi:hypothetical protein, partial [Yoonia sp. 2307UL14-13]|uniref:hypothetical protein n=1 Tax=Yoonia sp. 2307UL14-13 TaxID=3126506 RepID=UPI00309B6CDC